MAGNAAPGERIDLPGATVSLDRAWLGDAEATTLFETLLATAQWEAHRIHVYGRWLDAPRLSCWMGDADAVYVYSGSRFEPHPWPEALLPLRERLQRTLDAPFNSVLANLYRDGNDRLGWHRDSEPELGPTPLIASISLGATRRFRLRAREPLAREGRASLGLDLTHGSLLVMSGDTQRNYLHAVPPTARPTGPRINLTFRHVIPRAATPAP